MDFTRNRIPPVALLLLAAALSAPSCLAQNSPQMPPSPAALLDQLNAMISGGKSAWTPEQLSVMEKLTLPISEKQRNYFLKA